MKECRDIRIWRFLSSGMIVDRTLLLWYVSVCPEDSELLLLKVRDDVMRESYFEVLWMPSVKLISLVGVI